MDFSPGNCEDYEKKQFPASHLSSLKNRAMKFLRPTALIAAAVLVYSCGNNSSSEQSAKAVSALDRKAPAEDMVRTKETDKVDNGFFADSDKQEEAPQNGEKKKQQQPTAQTIKPDWDKKIIKTGSLNLEVKDYNNFYASIREKVKSLGGYVAQEEQTQSDYKIENTMIIKVPVDQFDDAMAQLTIGVQKINGRNITSQDVTTEVVDTRSRMEAKKQVRQRYMDLLGQARNMNDILSVQSEINHVQEEIESATGRIEYLTHSSVFSTINLTYYQVLNAGADKPKEAGSPSFGQKTRDAFKVGWEIVSELFIAVITVWPLLLVSFLAFVAYKKIRKQKPKAIS
ncbi:MAG: DUF4349 domain-containing protein [Bacteroidetes bacterium]|jgi:hypothetical protein|nr:MAG: DUF4349 domain-containing protein [Bacteroidota bacterium]